MPRPASVLEYPPPNRPWDVVSTDLLQLPASYKVCVDYLSRYVVLAPLKDKTAKSVAHALIAHIFCPYSAPRVLLSDNGAEFRNTLLEEISQQFWVKQCFTVTYHPTSNGLVERANRKILEVLRPVVGELLETLVRLSSPSCREYQQQCLCIYGSVPTLHSLRGRQSPPIRVTE